MLDSLSVLYVHVNWDHSNLQRKWQYTDYDWYWKQCESDLILIEWIQYGLQGLRLIHIFLYRTVLTASLKKGKLHQRCRIDIDKRTHWKLDKRRLIVVLSWLTSLSIVYPLLTCISKYIFGAHVNWDHWNFRPTKDLQSKLQVECVRWCWHHQNLNHPS